MASVYAYPTHVLVKHIDWKEAEIRQGYLEACVEQDIAWQIKINRQKRSLTQRQLAKKLKTTQTSVARWEDPMYGKHSIPSLIKIAHAFDCALSVRLIPYSKLAEVTEDTSDAAYYVNSYQYEIQDLNL